MGVDMYKKIKIISTIICVLLTFPFHFVYDLWPNVITACFFPINESIWEHMKLFIIPAIIGFVVEMFIMKKKRICIQNNYLALLIEITTAISSFLIIFLPIYFKIGDNLIFTIILMILCIIFSKFLGFLVVKEKNCLILNKISLFLIIIIVFFTIYLTFKPIDNEVFRDPTNNELGYKKET